MADFDAIVVGSGMSGGMSAKELTERGLKVLLLERGPFQENTLCSQKKCIYRIGNIDPVERSWNVAHVDSIPRAQGSRVTCLHQRD